MKDMETDEYAQFTAQETILNLSSDEQNGLSSHQVQRLLEEYGYNQIPVVEESVFRRIAKRFWGPIPWMIEVSAGLSLILHKWEDFAIILVMLCLNAFLDFFQEHRALNVLKALRQKSTIDVTVLRDGHQHRVAITELVPGDIVLLRIGDMVPADVQLLDGDYLSIDESSLTGESLAVVKTANQVAYANTVIKQGEMRAVVINTGTRTRFSSVVDLVAQVSLTERSHFQKVIIQIGNFLIVLSMLMVALILVVGVFRHEDMMELVRFTMILAVASIPVALPAVLSVTMAVGAINLAKKQAIVSRLTSIEELAGVDIFCSDKTGTLTKNEMKVMTPITFNGDSEKSLLLYALLASRKANNDPIELPLFHHWSQEHSDQEWQAWQQSTFTPFNPKDKYTSALVSKEDVHLTVYKGAAQVLLDMADLSDAELKSINNTVELLASKGYRSLTVGKEEAGHFDLVGIIPLIDPPREDSHQVILDMAKNGVSVKMITGDNLAIAKEIGLLLGLQQRAVKADQLTGKAGHELTDMAVALSHAIYRKLNPEVTHKAAQTFANDVLVELESIYDTSLLEREFVHTHESALLELIESVDIFAEVLPEDKYTIVESLQKADHIVGMTGDGVNDAPALKKADCGFAVSNATDAARAAADIILTAPGLSVINEAIEQARATFERMRSYATFRIAETIRIILFMSLSIIAFEFYPITALMIILLAVLNDIPILAIAYDNVEVDSKPVRWKMNELFLIATVLGITGVTSSFLLFFYLREHGYDEGTIQSLLFLKLLIAGHSTIFVTRTKKAFWRKPWPSPMLLSTIFGTELIGTLIVVNGLFITSISWMDVFYIWLYALGWFMFNDVIKLVTYRLFDNTQTNG